MILHITNKLVLCYDCAMYSRARWTFYRHVALTTARRSFNGEPTNRVIIKYLHNRQ